MKYLKLVTMSALATLLAGCNDTSAPEVKSEVNTTKVVTVTEENHDVNLDAVIKASIESSSRSDTDKADDAIRKAAEVLRFTGVEPGMTVLELEAGGGYYTELLSGIVGPDGKVIYQNPAEFDSYIQPEDVIARFGEGGNRLANVIRHKSLFEDLSFAKDGSVDIVTWFLGPHELWFLNEDGDLFLGDPSRTYSEIFRVLKPGGKFVALDHKAAPKTPETSGGDTHRIDPDHVRARAEAAGFVFMDESNILANSSDNYDVMVFDPSVRRKTDRFLHSYTKPN